MALFFCHSRRQNIGGPGPSPGAASGPSGGPGPPAPCAPPSGLCAGLLRCARPCPPPSGVAPPRRLLPLGFASLAAGPALAVRGCGPRPALPRGSAPLRRVGSRPGSVGLGLPARGLARRSGPPSPPPPRPRRPCGPSVWAAGAVRLARAGPAPCPPPGRPPLVGLPPLRARLGPLRGSVSGGSPPSGPPLRGGYALAPPRRGPRAALRAAFWPLRGPRRLRPLLKLAL